ncbi:MAG TPA: tetratricopeptide repeat protein [Candidatus Omnitrophica bacterium]|nr:tetratricopeptide repeat protein [Candidatus Omnitrophota bacterium]
MKRVILCLILLQFLWVGAASSFWIWTPESGRWTNPKYAAKDTPEEQLSFASSFFEAEDYKKALAEFKKLIKRYPKSKEAAEAQYYTGLTFENLDKLYEAHLAYQKLIEKYPFSEKIDEAIEQQYKIGERFMTDERKKILGIEIPVDRYAIEVFDDVIENAPYGEYASVAQYKIGLILKSLARFSEAKEEFEKVVLEYPQSEWVEAAKFQIALCTEKVSLTSAYDQQITQEAKGRFTEFVKAHPDAELTKEAHAQIEVLENREARSNFEIGEFYEKQKKIDSAKLYYEYVFTNFPMSQWGIKAFERHQVLEMQ